MTTHGTRRLASKLLPQGQRVQGWTRPLASCIDAFARFGYVARAAVYISIGAMSLLAALGPVRRAEGPVGALESWSHWPLGVLFLWTIGFGLLALAGWRFLQAALDADRVGESAHGLMRRASKAANGVVDLALALSVFHLLLALGDGHDVDDQASLQAMVARALEFPGGGLLLIAIGAAVAASGIGNIWRAATGHFTEDLDCEGAQARWAGVMGRLGHLSQGFSLLAVGSLTGLAGWQAKAYHARGLGGALETLKDQPMGHTLLGALGVGFAACGVFALVKAGLRRIGC